MSQNLQQISLQGYKSIKELDLKINQINILIGANGAGKSNFISIFSLLRYISRGQFQQYVKSNGGANSMLHFGVKTTSELIIDIKLLNNSYHVKLAYDAYQDTLAFTVESCTWNLTGEDRYYRLQGRNNESGLYDGEAENKTVRDYTLGYMESCRVYHFHDASKAAAFKQTSLLDATEYFYADAGNIAAFLYRLKKEFLRNYLDIVNAIQAVTPFFHDFYLEPTGEKGSQYILLKWLHKKHDDPFSAQQLSDGTGRFICLATLFLQPDELRPATILLDEPELGLHPAALEVLSDIIKVVSKTTQIICSTQSVTFSNHFQPEDFIVVDENEGVSTFSRKESKELKAWLEDYKMGDIWNKNLIGGRPKW